jgi:hypothetical protein
LVFKNNIIFKRVLFSALTLHFRKTKTLCMRNILLLIAIANLSLCAKAQVRNYPQSSKDSVGSIDSSLMQESKEIASDNIPEISLSDNDLKNASAQNVSSLLAASRDPFLSQAAFNFSIEHFRLRGYDADESSVFINGVSMNSIDNGAASFSLWNGLNDVFRNRHISEGLAPNDFSFGSLGSTLDFDTRASRQRKQNVLSYSFSNGIYTNRFSFTHNSGINKNGWAFSFSASARSSKESYVPGTFYNGASAFISLDKKFRQNNLLSFSAFAAPSVQGLSAPAVAEISNLAGSHYYNPDWGFQNGEIRNADVAKTFEPVFILTHELHINNTTTLTTSASYLFGNRDVTGLDWYNAPDPEPDYYGYLPSAQTGNQQQQTAQAMSGNENLRQINWQNLYDVNRSNYATIQNANGIEGNDVSGLRSLYVLADNMVHTNSFSVNSVLHTALSAHVNFTTGISFQSQQKHYYQKINDLLGGDFYVDWNQFAVRDFPNSISAIQNNLNEPNKILHVGDVYGYDYDMNSYKAQGWWQAVCKLNRIDFFAAAQLSLTDFWRTGNTRYGLFPDDSYGKSTDNYFGNYATKAGLTYKINGRNYLFVNAAYLTRAPYYENVYISPRTRDFEQDSLTNETDMSFEGGYMLNTPKIKIHLTGFYTTFKNQFDVISFYDDDVDNFVNYALSHINKLYFGGELGAEIKISPTLTLNAAASVGRYYYTSREKAIVTLDNSAAVIDTQTIYSNNYRIPSTPQEVYSAGISYRSAKNLFLNITANYFDQMWLEFNPLRRTEQAVADVPLNSQLYNDIIDEVKLQPQCTVNFYGSYSRRLYKYYKHKKSPTLMFNCGINNLLNNQNIIAGGYEQLRFDFENLDVNKFPPKYSYAFGLTFSTGITILF